MVVAAFWDSGWRKALTPFEITSIPVAAVQPAATDRRIKKRVRSSTAVWLVLRQRDTLSEEGLDTSDPYHQEEDADAKVGGDGEELPRLPHAAQIHNDNEDDGSESEGYAMLEQARHG